MKKMMVLAVGLLTAALILPTCSLHAALTWGFGEHILSSDLPTYDGSRWRYGYQVAASPDDTVSVNSFEISIDPSIAAGIAVQDPTLPSGWTVQVTGGTIRFETLSNPILPGNLYEFSYFSPLNPGNAPSALYNNPPIWFGDALAPNIGFFNGRPLNAWIGLGGAGPWTTRQVKLNEIIDTPNHKKIDATWRGEYSLGVFPPGTRAAVAYHYTGEGKPAGAPQWNYTYFAENLSTVADNSRGKASPYDLFDWFGPDAAYFISWTRYAGPPAVWDAMWPDMVLPDKDALGPKGFPPGAGGPFIGTAAFGFINNNPPIWATKNAGINPDFSPSSPFNLMPMPVPEPSSLVVTGLAFITLARRRYSREPRTYPTA